MCKINKHFKSSLLFLILTLTFYIFTGCSSNKEMKTVKEQEQSNTEIYEESYTQNLKESTEVIEQKLDDAEIQEMNDFNDFQGVLINIASTHPGTAGCNLQALHNTKDLLNFCKAKLPFDEMAKAWACNLYPEQISDTHDSFILQLETLERLSQGDDKKEFNDNDIENDAPYDKEIYNIAINAIKTVIDCTK